MIRIVKRATWIAATMAIIAIPAFADYQQAFREGVRNYDQHRYSDAIEYFKAAIGANPRDTGDSITINGGYRIPYLPHHYLAAAYALNSQCSEAHNAMRSASGGGRDGADLIKLAESKCGKPPGPSQEDIARQQQIAEQQKKADEQKKAEAQRIADE